MRLSHWRPALHAASAVQAHPSLAVGHSSEVPESEQAPTANVKRARNEVVMGWNFTDLRLSTERETAAQSTSSCP
jgi:hypothetical protein